LLDKIKKSVIFDNLLLFWGYSVFLTRSETGVLLTRFASEYKSLRTRKDATKEVSFTFRFEPKGESGSQFKT
jgi:hypothetical protein